MVIIRKAKIYMSRILKIAVCDDDKTICSEIELMLEQISQQLKIRVEISIWFSGEAVCDFIKKGSQLDIIFLEIELLGLSGIEIGKYIRNDLNNLTIQIVYISSNSGYALKLFNTQPYDFLIKPISYTELLNVVKGISKIIIANNQMFEYKSGRNIYKIEYEEILYFKSDKHKVIAVTKEKDIAFYGKLKNIMSGAPSYFLPIHKSYFININYIKKYAFNYVEMYNHDILTISKAYQKKVREIIFY